MLLVRHVGERKKSRQHKHQYHDAGKKPSEGIDLKIHRYLVHQAKQHQPVSGSAADHAHCQKRAHDKRHACHFQESFPVRKCTVRQKEQDASRDDGQDD